MKKKAKPEQTAVNKEVKSLFKRFRQGFYRPNLLLTLEKRQMFDGAAGAILGDEVLDPDSLGSSESLPTPTTEASAATSTSAAGQSTSTDSPGPNTDVTEDTTSTSGTTTDVSSTDPTTASNTDTTQTTTSDFIDSNSDGIADISEEDLTDTDSTGITTTDADSSGVEDTTPAAQPASATEPEPVVSEPAATSPIPQVAAEIPKDQPAPETEPEEEIFYSSAIPDIDGDDINQAIGNVVFIDYTVDHEPLLDGILDALGETTDDDLSDSAGDDDTENLESLLGDFVYETNSSISESVVEESVQDEEQTEETADESEQRPANQFVVGNTLVVLLQSDQSAIQQITETLDDLNELAAVHIVSHGSTGQIRLGNETIDSTNLVDYSEVLAGWGESLNETADILLYGCETGTPEGEAFVDEFAALTKADVAASDDLTGNAAQGGDWELEYESGEIEAQVLLNEENAAAFTGVLMDTDGDGIDDATDIDDDNDGILDVDEGLVAPSPVVLTQSGNWSISGNTATVDLGNGITITADRSANGTFSGFSDDNFNPGGAGFWSEALQGDDSLQGNFDFSDPSATITPDTVTFSFTETATGNPTTVTDPIVHIDRIGGFLFSGGVDSHNGAQVTLGGGLTWTELAGTTDFDVSSNTVEDASVPSTGSLQPSESSNGFVGSAAGSLQINAAVSSFTLTFEPDPDNLNNSTSSNQFDGVEFILQTHALNAFSSVDTDGDGIDDHLDLDSDNDGISDLAESGADVATLDADGNGVIDGAAFVDVDSDGLADALEATNGADTGTATVDTDSDGIANFIDLDSDNDFISDAVEALPTAGFVANDGDVTDDDADSDGVIDLNGTLHDANDAGAGTFGGTFVTPEDTDSDGIADYTDTDSDADGYSDRQESGLAVFTVGTDSNMDGGDDLLYINSYMDPDTFADDPNVWLANVDGDASDVDFRSFDDKDNDGIADNIDIDDDNDGILDVDEGGGNLLVSGEFNEIDILIPDPISTVSLGIYDPSADYLGWDETQTPDYSEGQYLRFSSPMEHSSEPTEGLGIINSNLSGGGFGLVAIEGESGSQNVTVEAGETYTLSFEVGLLPRYDAVAEYVPRFDFGIQDVSAGITDMVFDQTDHPSGSLTVAAFPDFATATAATAASPLMLDPNWTIFEHTFTATTTGEVRVFFEATTGNLAVGTFDSFRLVQGSEALLVIDTDGDGIEDHCDLDSDNDGISDLEESGADVATLDADGNGVIDGAAFVDADSDGLADAIEATNGADTGTTPADTDSDGIANFIDLDSDDDGIVDTIEADPTGSFEDPSVGTADADSDGILSAFDNDEANFGAGASGFVDPQDTDSDGISDYLDLDSDSDGLFDVAESGIAGSVDADSDGILDDNSDSDSDGLVNSVDTNDASFGGTGNDPSNGINTVLTDLRNLDGDASDVDFRSIDTDKDSDGIGDLIDIDDDNDGILDTDEGVGLQIFAVDWVNATGTWPDGLGTTVTVDAVANTLVGGAPSGTAVALDPTTVATVAIDPDGAGPLSSPDATPISAANPQFDGGNASDDILDNILFADSNIVPGLDTVETITYTFSSPIPVNRLIIGFEGMNNNFGFTSSLVLSGGTATDADFIIGDFHTRDPLDPTSTLANITFGAAGFTPDGYGGTIYGDPTSTATVSGFTLTLQHDSEDDISFYIGSGTLGPVTADTDGDGILDHCDLDSDNDGISDLVESGNSAAVIADANGDGTISLAEGGGDSDSDGLMDAVDADNGGTATVLVDSDSDSLADVLDLDSDNDGIADIIEGQPSTGYTSLSGSDADSDGIDDNFDGNTTFGSDAGTTQPTFSDPTDTDSDGVADYLDLDSDSDGINDQGESGLTLSNIDANGDGIDDNASIGASYADPDGAVNAPLGGATGLQNVDSQAFDVDFRSLDDKDGDGILDVIDIDDDNDGILDVNEFITLPGGTTPAGDAANWTVGDLSVFTVGGNTNGLGYEESGFEQAVVQTGATLNIDADPINEFVSDGGSAPWEQGTVALTVNGGSVFMFDSTNDQFNSGPGGTDGISLGEGLFGTVNTPFSYEIDINFDPGSGVNAFGFDLIDLMDSGFTPAAGSTHGYEVRVDGVTVWQIDSQALIDGGTTTTLSITDGTTAQTTQTVGHTIENFVGIVSSGSISQVKIITTGLATSGSSDDDHGLDTFVYATLGKGGSTDGDGIADLCDLDSDNDGISDLVESGDAAGIALDVDNNGTLSLSEGVDSDSDGLMDVFEDGNLTNNTGTTAVDSESDGIADFRDLDSDDDGIVDTIEADPTGGFEDPSVGTADADSDGILSAFDNDEANFGAGASGFVDPQDTDSDGVADFLDTDSDSDDIADVVESGIAGSVDADSDGRLDDNTDADSDGLVDAVDTFDTGFGGIGNDPSNGFNASLLTGGQLANVDGDSTDVDFRSLDPDKDGDGIADRFDLDDDNDGILDVDEGFVASTGANLLQSSEFNSSDLTSPSLTLTPSLGYFDTEVNFAGWLDPGTPDWSEGQYVRGSFANSHGAEVSEGVGILPSNNSGGGFALASITGEGISQTVTVTGGTTYTVSFEIGLLPAYLTSSGSFMPDIDFGVNNVSAGIVDFALDETDHPNGGLTLGDFPDIPTLTAATSASPFILDPSWTTFQHTFTAVTTGDVTVFLQTNNNDAVVAIDTVRLVEGTTAVDQVRDTDSDGIADHCDLDSDNDGISDLAESGADIATLDADGNGVIDGAAFVDADSDGLADAIEATNGVDTGTTPADTDSDGIANFIDLDSDNDLTPDAIEGQPTTGYVPFAAGDADSDGIVDVWDGDTAGHGSNGAML